MDGQMSISLSRWTVEYATTVCTFRSRCLEPITGTIFISPKRSIMEPVIRDSHYRMGETCRIYLLRIYILYCISQRSCPRLHGQTLDQEGGTTVPCCRPGWIDLPGRRMTQLYTAYSIRTPSLSVSYSGCRNNNTVVVLSRMFRYLSRMSESIYSSIQMYI